MPPRTRRASSSSKAAAAAAGGGDDGLLLTTPPPQAAAAAAVAGAGADRTEKNVLGAGVVASRGAGTLERDHDPYTRAPSFLDAEWRVFWTSVMFLTRLPVPSGVDHHAALLMRAVGHFPLIGVVVGAWGAAWYAGAALLWSPPIAAAASCLAMVWMTGCFHEDGLCDTFDGFGGGWSKEQILTIMQDSRVGTYGVVGACLILTAKINAMALLSERAAAGGPAGAPQAESPVAAVCRALIAAQCASRWGCVALTRLCDYVTDPEDAKRGLYNWFAESGRLLTNGRVAAATLVAVAVPAALFGGVLAPEALLTYGVVAVATAIAGWYGNIMIGGVIGDYLGATVIATELAILLALGADWRGAGRALAGAAAAALAG